MCRVRVALEGELRTYFALSSPLGPRGEVFFYALAPDVGDERRLLFDVAPSEQPGARIRVWGLEGGEAIKVVRYEVVTR